MHTMFLQTLISHKAPRIDFLAPPPPHNHYVQGTNQKLPGSKVSQATINKIFYLHDYILYISNCSSLFWCYVLFDMCIIGYDRNKALLRCCKHIGCNESYCNYFNPLSNVVNELMLRNRFRIRNITYPQRKM